MATFLVILVPATATDVYAALLQYRHLIPATVDRTSASCMVVQTNMDNISKIFQAHQ